MKIYYKVKKIDNSIYAYFMKENGEEKFISNDLLELQNYFKVNSANTFIGGDNIAYDNVILNDCLIDIPMSLDSTEGLNETNGQSLDLTLINLGLPTFSANLENRKELTLEDTLAIKKELAYKVNFIKELFEERKDFFGFKLDLIKRYNLDASAIKLSYSELNALILGIDTFYDEDDTFKIDNRITISNDLLQTVLDDYNDFNNKKGVYYGDCFIDLSRKGISGCPGSYIENDPNANLLYIDFNSFGPSILINNNWLNGACAHPERYQEITELRLKLKAQGNKLQDYYKILINDVIDLSHFIKTDDGINIGRSIGATGALIMTELYSLLDTIGVKVINANTDGLIISCNEKDNDKVYAAVKKIEDKYNMSADIDLIKSFTQKTIKSYVALFDTGKVKHIGDFGARLDKIRNNNLKAVSEAVCNYFLYNINVMDTLNSFVVNNDVLAFQTVLSKRKGTNDRYVFENGEYKLFTGVYSRIFAVSDKSNKMFYSDYKSAGKVRMKKYSPTKGGIVNKNYEIVDDVSKFDISRLDLSYYASVAQKLIDEIEKEFKNEKNAVKVFA